MKLISLMLIVLCVGCRDRELEHLLTTYADAGYMAATNGVSHEELHRALQEAWSKGSRVIKVH